MWCFAQFGINLQILKTWKAPREECYCSKVSVKSVTLLRVTLLHRYFSCFLNCINRTKSRKASHIYRVFSLIYCAQSVLASLAYYSDYEWLAIFRICELETFREYINRLFLKVFLLLFLIGIHSMQGWTVTTRHGVKIKKHNKITAYSKSV